MIPQKKRKATVLFPEAFMKEQFTGELYGFHIENTNHFNVMNHFPEETLAQPPIRLLGKVYPAKPKQLETNYPLAGYWVNHKLIFISTADERLCLQRPYAVHLDIFSRNSGIMESEMMRTKTIVISGLGSVGSLVALELARAGVSNFLLADDDILAYHNLCRHQCGIFDVGRFKVDAVKERILQINPQANVVAIPKRLEEIGQPVFDKFMTPECLMAGCADNRYSDRYISKLSEIYHVPMVAVGFWERAFAGEVFYSLPGSSPNYDDFMKVVDDISDRKESNHRFYTHEANLERVHFEPGISVDINYVTTVAIKIMLDLLNRQESGYTQRLVPSLTNYTLICNTNNPRLGGANAELFAYPLQVTTSIQIPTHAPHSN